MFIGSRIQRLFAKSPNIYAYFPHRMNMCRKIHQNKKILFLHSIMSLDNEENEVKSEGRKEGIGFYVAFNSLGHIATR